MEHIILASGSPRRLEFFKLMGLPFSVMPAMVDETPLQGLGPRQAVEELAVRKALAASEKLGLGDGASSSACWVFGADTIVVLDGQIFGKAHNRDSAGRMLQKLSGRAHEVITAIALHNRDTHKTDCCSVCCEVEFAPLAESDIEWYLSSGEWEGAAGAYRLQSLGACLVKSVKGSPSAVAGLPLHEFYNMLKNNGCHFGA